jgi:uncharacterized protein YjbI with pentapeptide repeats
MSATAARTRRLWFMITLALVPIAASACVVGPPPPPPGADCTPANLVPGADLRNKDLSYCDMTQLDLHGADFRSANLTGANATGANLQGATFVLLQGGWEFWCGCQVLQAYEVANVGNLRVALADLSDAMMTDGQMEALDPNWLGTDFDNISWSDSFTWQTLTYGGIMSFEGSTLPHFDGDWDFIGRGAVLAGASFRWLSFDGADLSGMNLTGLSCYQCELRSSLVGSDLTDADLTDADLGGNFTDAVLHDAVIQGVQFGDLTRASLLGATGTPFSPAATYAATTCPDGVITDGTTVPTCAGHWLP